MGLFRAPVMCRLRFRTEAGLIRVFDRGVGTVLVLSVRAQRISALV